MRVILTELPGVTIIEPQIDGHGSLSEPGNQSRNRDARLPSAFVHHNLSFSARGVLRGLHFSNPKAQDDRSVDEIALGVRVLRQLR